MYPYELTSCTKNRPAPGTSVCTQDCICVFQCQGIKLTRQPGSYCEVFIPETLILARLSVKNTSESCLQTPLFWRRRTALGEPGLPGTRGLPPACSGVQAGPTRPLPGGYRCSASVSTSAILTYARSSAPRVCNDFAFGMWKKTRCANNKANPWYSKCELRLSWTHVMLEWEDWWTKTRRDKNF